MVVEEITNAIRNALEALSISVSGIALEHPADMAHGDYATNVALVAAKGAGKSPRDIAERIVEELEKNPPASVSKIEIAGPGFINFHLSRDFFANSIREIIEAQNKWGSNAELSGKKVMIEHSQPNPFKEFHIGHLMSNSIGESIARIVEHSGAKVIRANWQGDVGPHVAKAIWGKMQKSELSWGKAYVYGSERYEEHKEEIDALNKKIYEKSDAAANELYAEGRSHSLGHFEEIYKKLGMEPRKDSGALRYFDYYFFEGTEGLKGKAIVEEFAAKGVFEESDGAIVFRGERYGLHTRVFITSRGLPMYEAKEIGLNTEKFAREPDMDASVIVTGSEQDEYFKVVLKALSLMYPDIAGKTRHISHGMMQLTSGKMSSRKGNVVTGESLLREVREKAHARSEESDPDTALMVAVAAIKYSILKQARNKNIVFDMEKSLSFEGDSGPYLQYAHTRAVSVLERAEKEGAAVSTADALRDVAGVERMLYRFPEVVRRALREYEPHYIATYLTVLAGAFNNWYANEKILDGSADASYKLALTRAFQITMQNGLRLLGITAPQRM